MILGNYFQVSNMSTMSNLKNSACYLQLGSYSQDLKPCKHFSRWLIRKLLKNQGWIETGLRLAIGSGLL